MPRLFHCGSAFALVLLLSGLAFGQGGNPRPGGGSARAGGNPYSNANAEQQEQELRRSQRELDMMNKNHDKVSQYDEALARQVQIKRELLQLREASQALLNVAQSQDKDNLKKSAKLANQIVSLSKQLRDDLRLKKPSEKPEAIAVAETERANKMPLFAVELNRQIDQLDNMHPGATVDVNVDDNQKLDDLLLKIQIHAMTVKAIAKI